MISFSAHKMLFTADGKLPLDLSFEIENGSISTIYGASGAGKTTILRILAGFITPEKGKIIIDDETWLDIEKKINILPQKRNIGFVFQDFALFPNMTVRQNLKFALDRGQGEQLVNELIEVMELEQLQDRLPLTLSGGQKQRVAVARALVRCPKLLLLDEPFSSLDGAMRTKLQEHLLQVHNHFGLTTLLVSHDLAEIYKLSDKIIMLEKGKIIREGNPDNVFSYQKMSGKFQFAGEILNIEKEDIVYVVSIAINNTIVKTIATEDDISELKIGDKVLVASKAFNPIMKKVNF